MSENWKSVVGYEGLYEVSDHGQVRNVKSGRVLKFAHTWSGHPQLSISKDGKSMTYRVHRLVAFAFLPPPTEGREHVLHNDGNPANNHVSNLRWGTNKENMADRTKHGTTAVGQGNGKSVLSEDAVRAIRSSPLPERKIAALYGVSRGCISWVKRGATWKHVE